MSLEELSNLRNSINNQTNLSEEEKKTRIAVVQTLIENNIIEAEYNNQMSEFINKSVQLGKLKGDSFKIDLEIEIAEEGTAGTVMRFTYDGPSFDPFEKGENVSKSILKKITKNHTYSYYDVNKVSMEI